jgi:anaerobic selenocysteine-containing dehydrogenase
MIQTACPLDCFDACSVLCDSNNPTKVVASNLASMTNGVLCSHLYKHIHEAKRFTKPMLRGQEVSMSEALDEVAKAIKDKPWLLWRGSGNLGVMQLVTNLLAKSANGVLTRGTLCDGAGDAGIVEGRGVNRLLSPEQIAKSEVVVVWGRNITVTNSHLMPYIKDKKIVVIDPVRTKIAKNADIHVQIKPRGDFYLALLLARFIMMEDSEDREYLEEFASEYEEYYDFSRGFRIKAILEHIGVSLNDIGDLLLLLQNKKVVFLVGVGVQKYQIGDSALRAIDALAAMLGLFGKEGCGVSYLSNSKLGFSNPFEVKCKSELQAVTPFSNYKSVIVQGGNPAESMPCSNKVAQELEGVENLIYFGLYENETSKMANIVIPAKSFLEKDDVRLSYGHQYVQKMNKAYDTNVGISEYEFVCEILKRLDLEPIKEENYYIDYWLKQAIKDGDRLISPGFEEIPYKDGFGEDSDKEFEFIDDFYDDFEDIKALTRFRKKLKNDIKEYFLIVPKSNKMLNTQFGDLDDYLYVNPSAGLRDKEEILVKSLWGELSLKVKNSSDIRDDCVLIKYATKGANRLTPPISSLEGDASCYGDVKVKLLKSD